jgi:sulfopyruvate decarboxylase TPP-binding subunit
LGLLKVDRISSSSLDFNLSYTWLTGKIKRLILGQLLMQNSVLSFENATKDLTKTKRKTKTVILSARGTPRNAIKAEMQSSQNCSVNQLRKN